MCARCSPRQLVLRMCSGNQTHQRFRSITGTHVADYLSNNTRLVRPFTNYLPQSFTRSLEDFSAFVELLRAPEPALPFRGSALSRVAGWCEDDLELSNFATTRERLCVSARESGIPMTIRRRLTSSSVVCRLRELAQSRLGEFPQRKANCKAT